MNGLGGEFHVKAGGFSRPSPYFACKVNGGFFRNPSTTGLPAIQGLILLSSASDGRPLAVMESGLITAFRTAAATAVAVKYLAKHDTPALLLVGSGRQAAMQAKAVACVVKPGRILCWSRTRSKADTLAAHLAEELKIEARGVADLAEAARDSEIIVTCTPSKSWLLGKDMVAPGAFVAAVGADSPDKQEIEPALLAKAAVVTDVTEQCAEVGDLHHAIAAGLLATNEVRAQLGEVVAGQKPGRLSPEEIVVFDSTGTAIQDAAAAALVYEKALLRGNFPSFPFWG